MPKTIAGKVIARMIGGRPESAPWARARRATMKKSAAKVVASGLHAGSVGALGAVANAQDFHAIAPDPIADDVRRDGDELSITSGCSASVGMISEAKASFR
jgi:hypothetical protein